MIAYFPEIYPDELCYSVLARFQRHLGVRGAGRTLEMLFGRRDAPASFDLPIDLAALAERVGGDLTVDRLIDDTTLLPYYTAFQPAVVREEARAGMATHGRSLHMRLGLSVYRVGRVARMRFCPCCAAAMLARHGEGYWRRDHQLPSVLVCPDHGCVLRESGLALTVRNRHEFVAATSSVCPEDAPPVVEIAAAALSRLKGLAVDSAALLRSPPEPRTQAELCREYRERMLGVGLMHSPGRVDMGRLPAALETFYGEALRHVPGALHAGGRCGTWLAAMVRNYHRATHPAFHLLLRGFLASLPEQAPPAGGWRRWPARPRPPVDLRTRPAVRPWLCAPRRDWAPLDAEISAKLVRVADELRDRLPPVRLTHAALERPFGRRDWISQRSRNLPRTLGLLKSLVESTRDFQVRRIHWAIGELMRFGPRPQVWQVARKANVTRKDFPLIAALLEDC